MSGMQTMTRQVLLLFRLLISRHIEKVNFSRIIWKKPVSKYWSVAFCERKVPARSSFEPGVMFCYTLVCSGINNRCMILYLLMASIWQNFMNPMRHGVISNRLGIPPVGALFLRRPGYSWRRSFCFNKSPISFLYSYYQYKENQNGFK